MISITQSKSKLFLIAKNVKQRMFPLRYQGIWKSPIDAKRNMVLGLNVLKHKFFFPFDRSNRTPLTT